MGLQPTSGKTTAKLISEPLICVRDTLLAPDEQYRIKGTGTGQGGFSTATLNSDIMGQMGELGILGTGV